MSAASTATFLSDYQLLNVHISDFELCVDLAEEGTLVTARSQVVCHQPSIDVTFDGRDLELINIQYNGEPLDASRYSVTPEGLILHNMSGEFELEIQTMIHPETNTTCSGLYRSGPIFCTQCEPQGFRRITYFIDRPDHLCRYRCKITADRQQYPDLLANGNKIASGDLPSGRHWVLWEDPFPKPSYLFALVAGDFAKITDSFTTQSGRDVELVFFVEHGQAERARYAMTALQRAMRWDEQRYQREYDLDIYMVVAVSHFNMGAMENKGLNIFNDKFVLVDPETATDDDYEGVLTVIAHEYFHNWTGNRITCRDWFQLSLKEGLTVFRDQCFTADMTHPTVKRIHDVRKLQAHQFAEDDGPMAHAVRPEFYIEINNFYTATVYEKGAELVRMLHALLGEEQFFQAMALYFERYDGQAVTIEDFLQTMQAVSSDSLAQFQRWYTQPGTPQVQVTMQHDPEAATLTLTLRQSCRTVVGYAKPQPFLIPISMGLLRRDGQPLPLALTADEQAPPLERVIHLQAAEQSVIFHGIADAPVPSLLRHFSAPVNIDIACSDTDLLFLCQHDSDEFNRWQSGQKLIERLIKSRMQGKVIDDLVEDYAKILATNLTTCEPRYLAECLQVPPINTLLLAYEEVDLDDLLAARRYLISQLVRHLQDQLVTAYQRLHTDEPYSQDSAAIGARRCKNVILTLLMTRDDSAIIELCQSQYRQADNMTDSLAALANLCHHQPEHRSEIVEDFYHRWHLHSLVLDKWFAVQAASEADDAWQTVQTLLQHEKFTLTHPNRVRSLLGVMAMRNLKLFHRTDGAAYRLLSDYIIKLDAANPQIAARLVQPLCYFKRFDAARQRLMRDHLLDLSQQDLSKDVQEIIQKAL